MGSDKSGDSLTNALFEAALAEMADEDAAGTLMSQQPQDGKSPQQQQQQQDGKGTPSAGRKQGISIEKKNGGITGRRSSDEHPPISPIRMTPAASRQASGMLPQSPPSSEAQNVLARLREALPTLREYSDVATEPGDVLSKDGEMSRGRSLEGQHPHMRRLRSEEVHNVTARASSMPQPCERTQRTISAGEAGSRSEISSSYPLARAPPDAVSEPNEFRRLLSGAVDTLFGSGIRHKTGSARSGNTDLTDAWVQTEHHRQQVLDSLFAKRASEDGVGGSPPPLPSNPSVISSLPSSLSRASAAEKARLMRQDSVISKGARRKTGSTINDDILQGLQLRDRPRAEGLSEAMQGPPVLPAGDQLAALSKNEEERNRAEVARLSLRHGFCAMLEAAQKRRTLEPALQAAFVSELSQLQKMPALKGLLKMREAHMPPQPQVLASIIGSHSRLGSITDSLAQMLRRAEGQGDFKSMLASSAASEQTSAPPGLASSNSVFSPREQKMTSPFEDLPAKTGVESPRFASPFESAASAQMQESAPSDAIPIPRRGTIASGSNHPSSAPRTARPRDIDTGSGADEGRAASMPVHPRSAGQQGRRRMPSAVEQPGSPGSDTDFDPHPPLDRHSARPIFGGIAKLVRGPSGQLEPPATGIATAAGSGMSRAKSGKLPQQRLPDGPSKGQASSPSRAYSNMSSNHGAEARRSLHADWQPPRPAGKPPSGSSDFGRAQSLLTQQPPEKSERDLERRRALLDAAEREAKFQAELWARFSGGGGSAAKSLHPARQASSPFSSDPVDRGATFRSPFSAASAASPFSQAPPAAPESGWGNTQETDTPFAKTQLPRIPRPSGLTGRPSPEHGQSAPPLPAADIESRLSDKETSRLQPEACSAPPHLLGSMPSQKVRESLVESKDPGDKA